MTRSAVMTCGTIAGKRDLRQELARRGSRSCARPGSRPSGSPATAALVARTIGKNAVMKIRKIDGTSPMPNQRIANGIHASGERLRKKFTAGSSARRTRSAQPEPETERDAERHRQAEAHGHAEQRRDDVVERASRDRAFSTNPRATSTGEGNAVDGKTSKRDSAVQSKRATSATPTGR